MELTDAIEKTIQKRYRFPVEDAQRLNLAA
jgi:hypothetical protein